MQDERALPEAHAHVALRVVVRARLVERKALAPGIVVENPELLLAVRVVRAYDPVLSAHADLIEQRLELARRDSPRHELSPARDRLPGTPTGAVDPMSCPGAVHLPLCEVGPV